MVTKRTTRSSSKAISSRENSPTVSVTDTSQTPILGRRHRSLNATLPAVGLKASTAYGTNNNAQSTRVAAPKIDIDVKNFLREILKPEKDGVTSARRSLSPSVAMPLKKSGSSRTTPERSFEMESKIFRGAGLESSEDYPEEFSPVHLNDRSSSHEISTDDDSIYEEYDIKSQSFARRSNSPDPFEEPNRDMNTVRFFKYFDTLINNVSIRTFVLIWAGIAVLFFRPVLNNLHSSLPVLEKNLPNFTSRVLPVNESTLINQRLTKLEVDVSHILETSSINPRTTKILENILPRAIVIKSEDGKLLLSQEFWLALRDQILADEIFNPSQIGMSHSIERDLNSTSQETWGNFIEQNSQKLKQLEDEHLKDLFPQLLHEHSIVNKAQVIEIIHQNWERHSALINEKMNDLALEIKHSMQNKKLKLSSLSSQDLGRLGEELTKYLPNAQLQAAAHVNIESAIVRSSLKMNHFASYAGALIDKEKTSSSYEFPSQARMWIFEKAIRYLLGNPVPPPNPPEKAMMKWDEAGECWCTPAHNDGGFGPSLGVILGNKIYPEEVVIENIQSSLSLEPGSAPKTLELFAEIEDLETRSVLRQQSQKQFPNLSQDLDYKLNRYVRIAAWIYKLDSPYNTQVHEIPLDLKAFGVGTSKLLLRITSNWASEKVSYTCLYRVKLHGTIVERPFED
ncbi:hypothetical protein OnM2_057005 [Erysiphe neolycopersici]|uniref:SUN domain-containing protein n=1 Tax=Erysiphe neolycopersici TaxID=212602 RepID=A0A420HQU1_9PEZI|nr:hypothetical protein OnM2_057005 [Erysiphe neolycopersici]